MTPKIQIQGGDRLPRSSDFAYQPGEITVIMQVLNDRPIIILFPVDAHHSIMGKTTGQDAHTGWAAQRCSDVSMCERDSLVKYLLLGLGHEFHRVISLVIRYDDQEVGAIISNTSGQYVQWWCTLQHWHQY